MTIKLSKKYYCDNCGRVRNGSEQFEGIEFGRSNDKSLNYTVCLCPQCLCDLKKQINNYKRKGE